MSSHRRPPYALILWKVTTLYFLLFQILDIFWKNVTVADNVGS